MDKTNVLFIVPLPPPVHGSAMVCQQIRDSRIINEAFRCDYVNLSTSRRMDEVGKFNPVKIVRMATTFFETFWLLLTHRYNACYLALACHGGAFLKDAPFVLLCKLFRRKIVIHQHNKGMAADVDRWPYRWLLPLVYRNVKVILLSWHLYPDMEKVVPSENVVVCPNGIAVPDNAYEERNNAVPHLLFLSNLMESKGVFVLLDALKMLVDKGLSFYCDFVGGETKEIDEERLKQEVKKRGLNQFVNYHGRKYGAEKDMFFEQSNIFIHPTYNDCFPLVLLEAMAHYLPIVTTDEGGIPDVVQDGINGIICERRNAQSLADGIERLLKDSALRRQMAVAGHKRLLEEFTTELFEKRMKEILIN